MITRLLVSSRLMSTRLIDRLGEWASIRLALIASLSVGALPVCVGWVLGTAAHQPLFGLLLTPILIGCLARGRLGLAFLAIAIAIGIHSTIAIYLSATDPSRAASIFQGSAPYWENTRHWIVTGTDPEYDWRHFLPAHLILVTLVLLGGYFTLSALPLMLGIRELDLMNFYVGRLIAEGNDPIAAVVWGWHPWSFIRGLGYSLLLMFATSQALARLKGKSEILPRVSWGMLIVGLALAVLDAFVKITISPMVREKLHNVLFG